MTGNGFYVTFAPPIPSGVGAGIPEVQAGLSSVIDRLSRVIKEEVPMSSGRSLHIGLNRVNPNAYEGWDGKLAGCENDARDMQAIARAQKLAPKTLLTRAATSSAVTAAIAAAAAALSPGDLFFLSYSGHGGQVPDRNGDETEDQMDETWVLYDRQLVDDELYALWGKFQTGVRILVLSDSCHSGTATKAVLFGRKGSPALLGLDSASRAKMLPRDVQNATYAAHKKLYDRIQKGLPAGSKVSIGASVALISGCQDNQTSSDGAKNGLFTEKLLKVWNGGKFSGSLRQFHREIVKLMPPAQTPNYFRTGAISASFERKRPFTV